MLPENREELQDKVVNPHSLEKVSQDKLETQKVGRMERVWLERLPLMRTRNTKMEARCSAPPLI